MAELRNRLVVETETLRTALNDSQNTIAVRESQLLREAAAAVQEAKQAVYDKVKAQFDAGQYRVCSILQYSITCDGIQVTKSFKELSLSYATVRNRLLPLAHRWILQTDN